MFEIIGEALWDALYDLRFTVFILYFAYLLIGYLTHHKSRGYANLLKKSKYSGPLIGAFLGCVPQCGFSSVMADVYSKRAISIGTLIAVFLATSDEAVPILISYPNLYLDMLILLGFKLVFAIIFGYLVDFVYMLICRRTKREFVSPPENLPDIIEQVDEQQNPCDCECHHHDHLKDEKHKKHSREHCCADNIFLDALLHTINIAIFIFVATTIINILISTIGLDFITSWLGDNAYLQILLCAVIGFIPNCAGSVFLVELFINGGVLFSAMIAGLSVGSGIGIFILFTKNKGKKQLLENLLIMSLLYVFGVVIGIFVNFIY